ncbi:BGN_3a_G0034250.mRNA.1.CDS.1 [Saccharomyces cerevisiae]|nr:BGN_3a_G0034250.mRNA.1.CDS.1 [Saccharomyces cerevisiae]CAI7216057.1 BGN_3a_G0034250.mRNA.1.CDS.1 [Saccharomyces cerevisiae]
MELFIPCPERLKKMMLKEELRKELLILRCLYHPTIQIMLPTLGTLGTKKKEKKSMRYHSSSQFLIVWGPRKLPDKSCKLKLKPRV